MRTLMVPLIIAIITSCQSPDQDDPDPKIIADINLKKGDLIWCGPAMANFGSVKFDVSAPAEVRRDFDQALAMLHSFEYEEAEKAFASVIAKDPSCAMAYWGVAMSNFHPLWEAPKEQDLRKGAAAINVAKTIKTKSRREADYIDALGVFYKNWQTTAHKARCMEYERAMSDLYAKYPKDNEAAVFYALALNTTADPTDKAHVNQLRAGDILEKVAADQPDHPGLIHYVIHNYDNPELAERALPAARKYASLAPASAHAQHMPSHIFVRLGLWDEAISSNLASVNSAKCYAEKAALGGNFDEELHGLDYLMYSYLQKGDNAKAEELLTYLKSIKKVSAQNFKVAYAYAAMPARYMLENKNWKGAAELQSYPAKFPWNSFPWQEAITVYARLLGKAHTNNIAGAKDELDRLKQLQQKLLDENDAYKAKQVEIQVLSGEAWIAYENNDKTRAFTYMQKAADIEDSTLKHPVTPGEVLPARELLAEMYLDNGSPAKALEAYKADLMTHPKRLNALKGAALAEKRLSR